MSGQSQASESSAKIPSDGDVGTAIKSSDPVSALDALLLHAVNINESLGFSGTILNVAIREKASEPVIRFLLSRGASPVLGNGSDTPLVVAAKYADPAIIGVLVDAGAPTVGSRALYDAAWLGRADVVRALLDKGAEINCIAPDDSTSYQERDAGVGGPLHAVAGTQAGKGKLVSESDQFETVRLLLERGADREMQDSKGRTPLAVAREKDAKAVIALLEGKEYVVKEDRSLLQRVLGKLRDG